MGRVSKKSKNKPKKKRNWRKYNEFRMRDYERMLKTLKKEVSRLPVPYQLRWKGIGKPPVDFASGDVPSAESYRRRILSHDIFEVKGRREHS
jgi:hypothetical protein